MRQVNFVLIFVICLALVLFGIENTEIVSIKIIEGLEIKAPLSIELILAAGVGAVFAWVFSVWVQVQSTLSTREAIEEQEEQIEELQADIERYKAELEEQQRLLPSASSGSSN
ncbi:lipopolysaccharide assembly protein LapA domain-containing protein [Lyngbya confervoides]|uniref:LapA family protein n=1 Tax=Lyngbya confervoides BDU141951 TaxID=1574623 RepID=A0ABD4T0J3_9CYAN|nr:LapA family protein [Lyngbya confervoides]MCM1982094.1 LapA family protein [Lyngbya confervoides BDU141951]